MKTLLTFLALLLFANPSFAAENSNSAVTISLTHHVIGYLAILVTVLAYVAAMAEDGVIVKFGVQALIKRRSGQWHRLQCHL
jgi:hypothetical protein